MVQLIKKGGLRERANRSRSYQGSENTEASLKPNRYRQEEIKAESLAPSPAELKLADAAKNPDA
ncbi:hypothetical protein [Acinetobacter sp.]|uniref:hypothetical protein n=1 Tax=Acinetobacter sp. TaxID=472 RepID=UPI002FC99E05